MTPFKPFAAGRRVVAAVSGGPDSMALALLLARWGQPLACIIDHGLRAESAAEAALTAQRLAALGIDARIMRADGLAHGPGLAERARHARYALLSAACREWRCPDLLVAHHAQDQAETVLLRRRSGSGALGLAGMAAVSYLDAARLLRPLLQVAPARLRATLAAAGVAWVEDPGNRDPATPRGAMRAAFTDLDVAALCRTAAEHGGLRRERERALAGELAESADIRPEGYAHVRGRLSPDALSALVWTVSGRRHPPPAQRVARGLAAGTLHGAAILPAGRLGPGWLVAREAAAMSPPVPATAGARWDGRFSLMSGAGDGASIGALGADAAGLRRRSPLPSAVLRTLPAIRRDGDLVCVPHLAFPDAATCRSLCVAFGPARPASGAPFVFG